MLQKILLLIIILLCPSILIAEESLKVGVVIGQTGAASRYAKFSEMGLTLAKEEINASGGVNGLPLELFFQDSRTQTNQGLSGFNHLVNNQKVMSIIGDVFDFLTNPLIPVAERNKIVLLSPTVMPHAITIQSPYFFTLGHKIDLTDSIFESYFNLHPEIKRVALLTWENDWGLGYAKKIKEILNKREIEIVEEVSTLDWNGDFKSEVTKIMQKNPDLIFAPYLAERIARRLKEFQSPTRILTTINILEPLMEKNFNKEILEDIYLINFQASTEYNNKFQARFQEEAQYESHLSYEALYSLVHAYQNNAQDLQAGLKKVTYQGQSGKIDFTKSNFGNEAKATLCKIHKGQVIVVE